MMAEPLEIVLVTAYFVAMIAIGVWASKKIQSMSDYVIAGRTLGFWVLPS